MKKRILLSLSLIGSSLAEVVPQPTPEVEHLQGNHYLFCWQGVPGRVYFIQTSSQAPSEEGFSWEFAPDVRVGEGSQLEMGFEADAAKAEFFRLVYVDVSGSQDPSYDADFEDFDGDGYSNLQEAMENTDPFNADSKPTSIKIFKDSDGDGISDQDEQVLGLDPETADDPNSAQVQEAGPLLISHSVLYDYYYQENSVWHPSEPGYVSSSISGGPQDGYRISNPWNLGTFHTKVNGVDFPREGDELSRDKAYVRKFNEGGKIIPSTVSRSKKTIDLDGDETRDLEIQKTAHMLKFPFAPDREREYHELAIPRYSIQERRVAHVTPGPANETEEDKEIRVFGIEDQGIYEDQVEVKTFKFEPANFVETPVKIKKASNIIELEHKITQVREDLWTIESTDLLPIEVGVDANRDGEISFNGSDLTSEDEPYQFWLNKDTDKGHVVDGDDWEEDDLKPISDSDLEGDLLEPGIAYKRDLEDLTRLWVNLSSIQQVFGEDLEGVTISMDPSSSEGIMTINLFRAFEDDGGREYLKDEDIADGQISEGFNTELLGSFQQLERDFPCEEIDKAIERGGMMYLLFEGCSRGKGELVFKAKKDDVEIAFPPVHIEIKDVTEMYETWSVGDVDAPGVEWNNTWPSSAATQISGQGLPEPELDEEKDYVLFIHGWNMPPWEKEAFASTMFKRLWHQGY